MKRLILFLILISSCYVDVPSSNKYYCYVEILNNKDYYTRVKDLLLKAKKSIYIIMYVIKNNDNEGDYVLEFLNILKTNKTNNVNIKIFLDFESSNYDKTINFLQNNNFNYKIGQINKTTHCKLIIIDNYYVIVGSHNWTESALKSNNETSVLICSEEVAKKEIEYFNEIFNKY